MSVLIKGMEMPGKGEYLMTLYVDSDGSAYIDVESFPEDKDKFDAIEVPPHGRLIDADKLIKLYQPDMNRRIYGGNFIHSLEFSPTIIPAEEGGT